MLSLQEINALMSRLNEWSLEDGAIVKSFGFANFKDGLEFVNKVGEVAEKMNHHPDIVLSYNWVRVSLTTHSERGLTGKDFEAAEEIDKV